MKFEHYGIMMYHYEISPLKFDAIRAGALSVTVFELILLDVKIFVRISNIGAQNVGLSFIQKRNDPTWDSHTCNALAGDNLVIIGPHGVAYLILLIRVHLLLDKILKLHQNHNLIILKYIK